MWVELLLFSNETLMFASIQHDEEDSLWQNPDFRLQLRPQTVAATVWLAACLTPPPHRQSSDSHRDAPTPAQHRKSRSNQHGWSVFSMSAGSDLRFSLPLRRPVPIAGRTCTTPQNTSCHMDTAPSSLHPFRAGPNRSSLVTKVQQVFDIFKIV